MPRASDLPLSVRPDDLANTKLIVVLPDGSTKLLTLSDLFAVLPDLTFELRG